VGKDDVINKDPIRELKNLYVRFHTEAKDNQEMEDESRRLFKELDSGNSELFNLWKKFRDLSIKGFEATYDRIGVGLIFILGKFFTKKTDEVVKDCIAKNICTTEEGTSALIIEDLDGLPSFLLRKQMALDYMLHVI
jgi:arginyl-tRNA synthetase